jgi:hypothetical protein
VAFDHSGNLWTSISVGPSFTSGALVEFSASQLTASGSPIPAVTLNGPSGFVAFDGGGNLWVATMVNGPVSIVEFASGQLGSTGSPTPAVTLTYASLGTSGLAFDGHGNLWIANDIISSGNYFTTNVVEFAASQLMASGAPTPTVTISSAGGVGLAFAP